MTRTLRCTVQYDGTGFAGFQRQLEAPTVQGALEAALERVTLARTTVIGAGRTDAGVHALGQVVHFRTSSLLPTATLQRALNACLPATVVVRDLQEAGPGFHARYDARSREYRYLVENAELPSPLLLRRAYHVPWSLSVEAMAGAARLLVGRHDFAPFGSPMEHGGDDRQGGSARPARGSTVRTMLAARCWRLRRFVFFGFVADAFLRHMVRLLVGTLLRVGRGRLSPDALVGLLQGERVAPVGPAVPAHGLYLVRVRY